MVLDIRQEAFRITSGFREKFSEVYLFNPVADDGKTMQWNPLSYVSDDPVLREARALRQRRASDVIDQLLARLG